MIKRLFYDIETAPNKGYFWRCGYKIDVNYQSVVEEKQIITIAWKWQGENQVYAVDWGRTKKDDKKLLQDFIPVMDSADEIVAHFGDQFDLPWIRARAAFHRIPMQPRYRTIDTCAWARKHFHFNSCKLDYLCQYFGFPPKLPTDYDLWKQCVETTARKPLAYMIEYNMGDVERLEKVYEVISQYMPDKTHVGVVEGRERWTCSHCGTCNVKCSGKHNVSAAGTISHQMHCNACGRYYSICDSVYKNYQEESRALRASLRR